MRRLPPKLDLTQNTLHVWRRKTLPVAVRRQHEFELVPGWFQWHQTDTHEQYVTNGNKEFSLEDVSYTLNSQGYRCKEFSEINHHAFKLLTTGCSETVGVGIPLHLTFTEQLASLIRQRFAITVDVINMAAAGCSIDYITRVLCQSVPILQPHYVFCLLPDMARHEYIVPEHGTLFATLFGRHNPATPHKMYAEAFLTLCTTVSDFFSMVKNLAMIELILRDTGWSWDTWMDSWWKLRGFETYVDLTHYRNQMIRLADRGKARDNIHCGTRYHTAIANDLITDPHLLLAIDRYERIIAAERIA